MGRHTGEQPSDIHVLAESWHIGRSWPGMFPHIEMVCPCPKASCGLVIPMPSVHCDDHHGKETIRQAHRADECEQWKKRHRRR